MFSFVLYVSEIVLIVELNTMWQKPQDDFDLDDYLKRPE